MRGLLFLLLCVPLTAQDHPGAYSQNDIERGFRLFGTNCAVCHGANGDTIANANLRGAVLRRAASDEGLASVITTGIPGTAMPPHQFQPAELTGLVAYIRSLRQSAVTLSGDAARGQTLFQGKGACLGCHRVAGRGSRTAPDLSEIGAARRPDWLQRALLDPTAAMLPMNRPVRAVTADGKTITGRRLNEDTHSVQLIDSDERLVSLVKSGLREYTILKVSPMPSYRDRLTSQELADVLAYLQTLTGER